MSTVYRSKIDIWMILILIAAIGLATIACISAISAGGAKMWWVLLPTGGLGIGLPVWVLLTTRYTLDSEVLLVQSGPFKWNVPVAQITGITPTRNPLSSPALSLDRLRIDYGNGRSLMVSPEDKEKFIVDIEELGGLLRRQNSQRGYVTTDEHG